MIFLSCGNHFGEWEMIFTFPAMIFKMSQNQNGLRGMIFGEMKIHLMERKMKLAECGLKFRG